MNKLIIDIANAVSESQFSSEQYLKNKDIDIEQLVARGLQEISKPQKTAVSLNKSQSFFRRVVLGAEIVNQCHREFTFGNVKFQKLQYLCEEASNMKFQTNYSKQAAGPFDNKLMHTIKSEFKKQGWFEAYKIDNGKYSKGAFRPLNKVDSYKEYYNKYFEEDKSKIQYLIDTFIKSKTDDVELVATIYYSWDEIIKEKAIFSNQLIINKVYSWHKSKKKFSENQIIEKIGWMKEKGIYPNE